MITALEIITEKLDAGGAAYVVSLPANQVSYRNIQLPFKEKRKIRQILPFELEPTLPFPVENLIIDFHPIKLPDAGDHTDIITGGAEISMVKSYMDILRSFKIEPELITVSGYPAALCLAKFANIPENCLFADIDMDKCTVFVIISGQVCLIRSFPISSNAGRTESICADIERTLVGFEEIFHLGMNFRPDEIHVTGYGLDNSGFEQDAERNLDIPVRRTDLVRNTRAMIKTGPTTAFKTSVHLDNAYALALLEIEGISGLNFRRGPFAPKKQWAEHRGSFIKTGILMLLVLGAVFLNMLIDSHSVERKLNRLESQIHTIFESALPGVKPVVPLHQLRTAVDEMRKEAAFPGETGKGIRAVDILNEISKRIPKEIDVVLTRFLIGLDHIEILGNTDTHNSVVDIKNRLEEAESFKEVTIITSSSDKRSNRIRFKLKVQL